MENPTTMCIICLEIYDKQKCNMTKLSSTSPDNETYMNQMQYALNIDFVFEDSSEVCMYCLEDLNKVYLFRKKFDVAVEYWKIYDSKLSSKTSYKIENADSDNEDKKELSEEFVKEELVATFVCGRCQLMFKSAAKLVSHHCPKPHQHVKQKIELMQSKGYPCTTCGKAFTNSFNLREHKASHSGTLNYTCEVCGKLFQRLSSQRRHLRTHQGKKPNTTPFLCNICGKSFPVSNGMQRHMRTHMGDRRHVCKICGKRFMQSTHLKVHLRTHTGEKPYSCPVCRSAFTLPATLRKHLKVHKREGLGGLDGSGQDAGSEETELAVGTLVTIA